MTSSARMLLPTVVAGALALLAAQPALAEVPVHMEQQALSFPFSTTADRGVVYHRVDLAALTETLHLAAGRTVRLEAQSALTAVVASADGELAVLLDFSGARGTASVNGRVMLDRTVTLRSRAGRALGELRLVMELDLHGLGDASPHVSLRRAEVVSLSNGAGWLSGARLSGRSVLAMPGAPLEWTVRD